MKEKILIVDDERDILRMLEYNLKKESFVPILASDGEEALEAAQRAHPHLIILDLMLPGMDGLEVCKALKKHSRTASIPVIMLTAKSQEADKIIGLELGADDYITKPFSPRELLARIKAVLRRFKAEEKEEFINAGTIALDLSTRIATLKKKQIELTYKEFELLVTLIKAHGRVLTRDYLLDSIWGYDYSSEIETRTVDVHINQLRKKLKTEGKRIVTVKNIGYRFDY
ncbi:MAG: response regulator transcription factor [Candidatus Omnitrophica bacterium]|nr:response regulator transcription factor [Candidatus Omnitrophota bacterium]